MVGKKIFSETVGIPLGSDPAPFFTNLLLHYYESIWKKDLPKKDLIKARKLCKVFCLVDDLNTINDDCSGTRTHNHLICKRTLKQLASLANWLSVRFLTNLLCVRIPLQSLKLQISPLLRARSFLTFGQL